MYELSFFVIAAFFLGALPTGFLVGKLYGVDVRARGSGNVGATNVGRVLGSGAGVLTFAGDFLKGIIAPLLPAIVGLVGFRLSARIAPEELRAILAAVAVVGHCFSPFLAFKGGKGVATGFGAFLVIAPIPAFLSFVLFGAVVFLLRIVSLGSIAAVICFIALVYSSFPRPYLEWVKYASYAVAGLIIFRHVGNIQRMLTGDERKLTR